MKMKNTNDSQPTNLTTTMKTTLLAYALLFASLISIHADESSGTASVNAPAQVFLIDDPTGDELARDHGIQPIRSPLPIYRCGNWSKRRISTGRSGSSGFAGSWPTAPSWSPI
jgi:hypothetical protein